MAEQDTKLEVLIGAEGIEKLKNATVLLFGLGGVGSSCAQALARAGVGHLIIVDHDTIQASNINRQVIAFHSTIGQRKVDVTEAMIKDIRPDIEVTKFCEFMLPDNLDMFFETGHIDYVIDAIDTVTAKLALAEYAYKNDVKLISSMGAANKVSPQHLKFADISKTVNCPLSKIIRKECRYRGIKKLRVLFSDEVPQKIESKPGAARSERSNLGTISYMPAIMGTMLAGDVVRDILDFRD